MNHTRTFSTAITGHGASARRRIRRTTTSIRPLYCRTNGCTTFMERVSSTEAVCPICGAHARVH